MSRGIVIKYDGHTLNDYVSILDVRRSIGNERTVEVDESPLLGFNLQRIKTEAKYIEIDVSLIDDDVEKTKHVLAGIFHKSSPKRLIFEDEPDKYYLAILDGEVSENNIVKWFQRFTLKLLVPDGVAHSSTYKRVTGQTNYIDKSSIAITNEGSIEAFPIITIQHSAENGYVGIVNQNGVMELGNRNESDTVKAQRSEYLLKFEGDDGVANAIAGARKNVAILNDPVHKMNSTCSIFDQWDKKWIGL